MNIERIKEITEKGESKLSEVEVSFKAMESLPDIYIDDSIIISPEPNSFVICRSDLPDQLIDDIEFKILKSLSDNLNKDFETISKSVDFKTIEKNDYINYYPIYRLKLERIPDAEIVKMQELTKFEENNKWIIAGYASVDMIDSVGDEIPLSALNDATKRFLTQKKALNLMLEHSSTQIGYILSRYKSLETKVDDRGLFIVAEIRKDLETSKEIWQKIKSQELNSFSVKVEVLKQPRKVCKEDGVCWNILEKINLVEISVVKNPANSKSTFEVVER